MQSILKSNVYWIIKQLQITGFFNMFYLMEWQFEFSWLCEEEDWIIEMGEEVQSLVWNVELALDEDFKCDSTSEFIDYYFSIFNIVSFIFQKCVQYLRMLLHVKHWFHNLFWLIFVFSFIWECLEYCFCLGRHLVNKNSFSAIISNLNILWYKFVKVTINLINCYLLSVCRLLWFVMTYLI